MKRVKIATPNIRHDDNWYFSRGSHKGSQHWNTRTTINCDRFSYRQFIYFTFQAIMKIAQSAQIPNPSRKYSFPLFVFSKEIFCHEVFACVQSNFAFCGRRINVMFV